MDHKIVCFVVIFMGTFDVVLAERKVCSIHSLQYYNPLTEECKNGIVIPRTTSTTVTAPPRTSATEMMTTTICPYDNTLFCDTQTYCGAREGFKCCGFDRYHPGFETCCRQTSAKYKIHIDKPEKEYICCNLEPHKRGSKEVPCNHPSLNDRLLRKAARLKKMKLGQDICVEDKYVYKIKITGHNQSTENPEMWARITMWHWNTADRSVGRPFSDDQMVLPLDKYSPKRRNLNGRQFLVFSSHPYHEDMVFFLNPQDNVYKRSKQSKIQENF